MLQFLKSDTFEDTLNQTILLGQYPNNVFHLEGASERVISFFFCGIEVNIGLWVGTLSPSLPRKIINLNTL